MGKIYESTQITRITRIDKCLAEIAEIADERTRITRIYSFISYIKNLRIRDSLIIGECPHEDKKILQFFKCEASQGAERSNS